MSFNQIPSEGLHIVFKERFEELYDPKEMRKLGHSSLYPHFPDWIEGEASLLKVGSKVRVQGSYSTQYEGNCASCGCLVELPLAGDLSLFLMPIDQFSDHDKPGGKVIHGPTRGKRRSRHYSFSKSEELTSAEGEHEDVAFGAYDGRLVDLRRNLRELLLLQIPMQLFCEKDRNRGPSEWGDKQPLNSSAFEELRARRP